MLRSLVLCVILGLFGSAEGHFRRVCQGYRLTIICSNIREIRIHYASYGRHEKRICAPGGRDTNTWCYTDRSLSVVRNMCQGKLTCTVQASNAVFGDPCFGTEKYLDLAFSCAPRGLLVRVCEGGTRVISCSVTKRINILFANYGRIAGSHICPGPIQTNNCGAARSLAIVRNDCQRRLRCTLAANNNKFGDPCPGTRKYLEVQFVCQ